MHSAGAGSVQQFHSILPRSQHQCPLKSSAAGKRFHCSGSHRVPLASRAASTAQGWVHQHIEGALASLTWPQHTLLMAQLTSALLHQSLPRLPQRGAFSQPLPALPWSLPLGLTARVLPHSHRAAQGLWAVSDCFCPCRLSLLTSSCTCLVTGIILPGLWSLPATLPATLGHK